MGDRDWEALADASRTRLQRPINIVRSVAQGLLIGVTTLATAVLVAIAIVEIASQEPAPCDSDAEHYVFRTQPEGARSGPGDTDLVMYSLRKYLWLATKGNPTALLPLYAPQPAVLVLHPLGQELRELASSVLSQRAVYRFLGYMNAQQERLLGRGRRSDVPNRPELVARYGYDVKYASHALRLAYQGLEIVRDGQLTLPMPEQERQRVLRVKQGDVPVLEDVLREIGQVRTEVEQLLAAGRTPLHRNRISLPSPAGRPVPTGATGDGPGEGPFDGSEWS